MVVKRAPLFVVAVSSILVILVRPFTLVSRKSKQYSSITTPRSCCWDVPSFTHGTQKQQQRERLFMTSSSSSSELLFSSDSLFNNERLLYIETTALQNNTKLSLLSGAALLAYGSDKTTSPFQHKHSLTLLSLLNDMKKITASDDRDYFYPSTRHYNVVLSALAKEGNTTAAFLLLEEMFQFTNSTTCSCAPDLVTLNLILDTCANAQNYNDARQLLIRMNCGEFKTTTTTTTPKNNIHNRGVALIIKPNVISYNAVLRSCSNPLDAIDILREMRNSRRSRFGVVMPTSVSYTNALVACRRAGDLQNAKQIIEMAQQDQATTTSTTNILLNVYLFTTYIWTAERCGNCEEAYHTLHQMLVSSSSVVQPNVISYNGVIGACCKDPDKVLSAYNIMKMKNIMPTKKTFQKIVESFNEELTTTQQKILKLEIVLQSLTSSHERRLGFCVMETLIRVFSAERHWENVMNAIETYYYNDEDCVFAAIHMISTIADAPSKVFLQLLQILQEMNSTSTLLQQAIAFLVMTFSKQNRWEDAVAVLHMAASHESNNNINNESLTLVPVAALNSLISSCGRNGRPDMALQLLHEMNFKHGVNPNTRSYRAAIMACNQAQHDIASSEGNKEQSRGGDAVLLEWWECSLSLLRRMKEDGLQPDIETYSSAISACEAAGKWQRALGVVNDMEKEGKITPNYVCINAAFSACEKGGAWVEALELYERMKQRRSSKPSFVTINSLLICLDKACQREMAENIYREAITDGIVSHWTEDVDKNGQVFDRRMDLHQFSASMSKTAVLFVLESLLSNNDDDINNVVSELDPTQQDLIIVVGKGKGNSRGIPVLLPVILNLFKELDICARVDDRNSGRVIVSRQELLSFIEKRSWR